MQDAGVALQKASNTHQKRESLLQVDEDHPYTDLLQNYADEYRARQLTRERVIHNLMVNGIDRRFVDDVMNNNVLFIGTTWAIIGVQCTALKLVKTINVVSIRKCIITILIGSLK